ncbi:hypothetical protein L1280_000792 [Deinococcus sp. HSC-46F16]|uniref:hypothetical protein n=1 Tax=Deinococcus sp. HSC-46F16 TaxID=2910968 RepID=UPI0020A194D0|nr:hypothetical protein [Deinococcus sp. HSC-46F16]MCP2013664.1 hypothetical protein [Deinococcus sp. HSC-46F16]
MKRTAALMAGALLLAGCAPRTVSTGVTPSAPARPVTQIPGDISRWSGTGSVALTGPGGQVLAQAEVAPDGRFTLPLPGAAALTPLLRSPTEALSALGCTGSVLSSDTGAGSYAFLGLTPQRSQAATVFAAQAERTGFVSGVFSGRVYLYVNRPTRLSGTVDCGPIVKDFAGVQAAVPVTVDVNAQPGWNALELGVNVRASLGGASAGGRLAAVADAERVWRTPEEVVQQVTGS